PITSLQKLANLSACLLIRTASFAPLTFSEAIACNGASLPAVDAMPNISKTIPIKTFTNTITKTTDQYTSFKMEEEILEKIAANTKVITAIVILNLIEFFIL